MLSGKKKLKISFEKVDEEKIKFSTFLLNTDFSDSENSSNQRKYEDLVSIDGIGAYAGSSAITDFFAEFNSCTSIGGVDPLENPERGIINGFEFDFFRDGHGVLALEKICDYDSNRITETAIRDFIKTVEYNLTVNSYFYNEYYLAQTQKFLKNLIDFSFECEGRELQVFNKKLTKKQYREFAKEYCLSLLKNIPSERILCLDCLLSITNPDKEIISQYFGNTKIVTSIRDPRDVYTSARLYPSGDIGFIPKDADLFVNYYKYFVERYDYKSNPNVLLIRFEDFVNNYNDVSEKIMSFVGLKDSEHINKFKYFNPEISKNNIGIYKNYKDQESIKIIEKELSEYCYNI